MKRAVLDVGNCGPDHAAISRVLNNHFDVDIVHTHGMQDTVDALRARPFDLVLVNRIMDRDGAEGLDIIQHIKQDDNLASIPLMMITNYAQHQTEAVAVGAAHGFGKLELDDPKTVEKLRRFLG